jgi:hypothetical protein
MAHAAERPRFRAGARAFACLAFGSICIAAGCGGSGSSNESNGSPPSSQPTPTATGSSTAQAPFVSQRYRYTINATDWTGSEGQAAWDGISSPGDGDPTVDAVYGPRLRRVWVVSAPTSSTLNASVAALRKANAKTHQCPRTPEQTRTRRIDGQPAVVDSMHCPPTGGVFALNAFVQHGGRIYLFFTYDQPGRELSMQRWFSDLLDSVSFDG